MKAYGKVTGDLYECAVWTDIPKVGNGWTVGDVIDVIYSLEGGSDHPGPWVVTKVWYEDGAWRMEAERNIGSEWGYIGTCNQCGKEKPVRWIPDPLDLEINPDDPQPDLWCEGCWHERHDDV